MLCSVKLGAYTKFSVLVHQFASCYLERFIFVLVSVVCLLVRSQMDMVSEWLFSVDVQHQCSAMQFTIWNTFLT